MMGTSQMGPSITAWICLLAGQFRMSVRNIQALLKDGFGVHFSTGAIS